MSIGPFGSERFRRASFVIAASVLFCVAVPIASKVFPSNARTFYCAGRAVADHRDPYLVEPLRSCEHAINRYPGFNANEVEPAPLPPYVLSALAVWSRFPYSWAHVIWNTLLLGSVVVAALAIARLTTYPAVYVFLALGFVDGLLNLGFGEVVPTCVALLCVSAVSAERRKHWTTVAAATAAMIEPHVALPASVALFIFVPATRARFLFCAILLSLAGIATLGLGENIEYFRSVLPAHALAEVSAPDQYSLTWLLHRLGVDSRSALRLGSFSYLVMGFVGVVLARKLAVLYASNAFLVLVPPAAVLLGGTFMHDVQIAAALPAALLLGAHARSMRRFIWIVAMLFAFPLSVGAVHLSGILFGSAAAAGIALLATRRSSVVTRVALCLIVIGSVVSFCAFASFARGHDHAVALHLPAGDRNELASVQWGRYIGALDSRWSLMDTLKVPLWLALIGFLAAGSAQIRPLSSGSGSLMSSGDSV